MDKKDFSFFYVNGAGGINDRGTSSRGREEGVPVELNVFILRTVEAVRSVVLFYC